MVDTRAPSRFAKPAWLQKKEASQSQAAPHDAAFATKKHDDVDIFKRGADTQAIVAAEKERRDRKLREKREKEEQARRERELALLRRADSASQDDEDVVDASAYKRRRISTGEEDGVARRSSTRPRTSTPQKQQKGKARATTLSHVVIDDSDDDSKTPEKISSVERRRANVGGTRLPPPESIINLSDDDDEPHPDARKPAGSNPSSATADHPDDPPSEDEGPNPVMLLFIEPRVPNTRPLLVQRRYNQKLKDVRLAWCRHNELPPGLAAEVIFTWRDRRLFDVQSCRGMGIKLDDEGRPFVVASDGVRETMENVALVATTRQIVEQEKREEKSRHEMVPVEPEEVAQPPMPMEKQYKVILRSKSYPDHKLLLKDDTIVQKAILVFRRQHGIPEEQSISILYDGEPLDPDTRVGDTELAEDYDGDAVCLEVHLR